MATWISELCDVGHCPAFALWVARLVARGGEQVVLAMPKALRDAEGLKEQVCLAVEEGVELQWLDRSPIIGYNVPGGAQASAWLAAWRAPGKGDRLIVPTLDYMLTGRALEFPEGVIVEVIYHQPMTLLPMIPPVRQMVSQRFGLPARRDRKLRWKRWKQIGAHRTYLLDPYETVGPGQRRMQRCLGRAGIAYLPIGTLNSDGYVAKKGCRESFGIDADAPFLVIPGNPDRRKDIGTLIRAWPKVRKEVPGAILGIFGERLHFFPKWDEMAGEGVIIRDGALSQSAMLGILQEADAVWAVRTSIGMSSIQEVAFQLGTVAIVSRSNLSSAWLADRFGGIKVIPGDLRSVARGVAKALNGKVRQEPVDLGVLADVMVAADVLAGRRVLSVQDFPAKLRCPRVIRRVDAAQ